MSQTSRGSLGAPVVAMSLANKGHQKVTVGVSFMQNTGLRMTEPTLQSSMVSVFTVYLALSNLGSLEGEIVGLLEGR